MFLQRMILLVTFILTASYPLAALTPSQLLKEALLARNRLRFTGVEITETRAAGTRVMSRVEIQQDGSRSRRDYQSGPLAGQSLIDDGRWLIQLNPRTRTAVRVLKQPEENQIGPLLKSYAVRSGPVEMISGQKAQAVILEPRQKGSPLRRLWIDLATRLVLQSEQQVNGTLIAKTRFAGIDYRTRPAASAFSIPKGWKVSTQETAEVLSKAETERKAGFKLIVPDSLPRGYAITGYSISSTNCGHFRVQIQLSDGMNSLSVFEQKAGTCGAGNCICNMGGSSMGMGPHSRGKGRQGGPGHGMQQRRGFGPCRMMGSGGNRMLGTQIGNLRVIVVGSASDELIGDILKEFVRSAEK